MKLPINKDAFNDFIEQTNIFELTKQLMYTYLENWYIDNPDNFVEDMGADFATVLKTYHFYNETVSFNKNFNFEPPLDSIDCSIRITDAEDDCCTRYTTIFDYNLSAIDDYCGK